MTYLQKIEAKLAFVKARKTKTSVLYEVTYKGARFVFTDDPKEFKPLLNLGWELEENSEWTRLCGFKRVVRHKFNGKPSSLPTPKSWKFEIEQFENLKNFWSHISEILKKNLSYREIDPELIRLGLKQLKIKPKTPKYAFRLTPPEDYVTALLNDKKIKTLDWASWTTDFESLKKNYISYSGWDSKSGVDTDRLGLVWRVKPTPDQVALNIYQLYPEAIKSNEPTVGTLDYMRKEKEVKLYSVVLDISNLYAFKRGDEFVIVNHKNPEQLKAVLKDYG